MSTERVLVITGPTATGKTALGVELALAHNGEVVSGDSMQLYEYMDIGTATPTTDEMRGVPHHMLSVVSPLEAYSVSRYVEDATRCVDDILARGRLPIIVGGTGLYIDALIAGRDFAPMQNEALRAELNAKYDALGGEEMLREMAQFDAPNAQKLNANDKKRVVRAFEVFALSGKPQSQFDAETQAVPPRYDALRIALDFEERDTLYARIDARVNMMMAAGLLDELCTLLEMGVTREHTSMQAIGYHELLQMIAGELPLDEAIAMIKQHSRQYAKRQLTWLRKTQLHTIAWGDAPDLARGVADSTKFLREARYS